MVVLLKRTAGHWGTSPYVSHEHLGVTRSFSNKTQRAAEAHALLAIKPPAADMKQEFMVAYGKSVIVVDSMKPLLSIESKNICTHESSPESY